MGKMMNAGGKGSATRPLSVTREVFANNFDKIFGKKYKDPVKDCERYKTQGCAHVDGPLCNVETCGDKNV